MEPLTALAVVLVLAALGEIIIESLKPGLKPLFDRMNLPEDVDPYLYLSQLLGVALALLFHADLLGAVGLESPYVGAVWFQRVVTGIILGRGANVVHKAIERISNASGSIRVQTTAPKDSDSTTQVSVRSDQDAKP